MKRGSFFSTAYTVDNPATNPGIPMAECQAVRPAMYHTFPPASATLDKLAIPTRTRRNHAAHCVCGSVKPHGRKALKKLPLPAAPHRDRAWLDRVRLGRMVCDGRAIRHRTRPVTPRHKENSAATRALSPAPPRLTSHGLFSLLSLRSLSVPSPPTVP